MKKLLTFLCATFALAAVIRAEDAPKPATEKPKMTAEQKALKKEMLEKYDANKDGKLDKEEKAKISAEDKAKMEKAGLTKPKKVSEKKDEAK